MTVPPPSPSGPGPAATPLADRGAVASESEAATRVGLAVLERGGSAIDAAIAMTLATTVVRPTSCSVAGGGFALVWVDGVARVVDFRERAPGGLRLRDHLGASPAWDKRGVMVGVPGLVAGLAKVHATGGKLPWSEVVGGARDLAARGFPVEPWLATTIGWSERDLRRARNADYLLPDGAVPKPGDMLRNEALARTLGVLADRGPGAFYKGPLADDVVASARSAGSTMTGADLASYEAVIREPLRVPWGENVALLPPTPSGGGVVVAQELLVFDPQEVAKLVPGTALYVHLVAEGLRQAAAERRAKVGDPDFTRADQGDLLDSARLRAVRKGLRVETTTPPEPTLVEDGGTCNVVAWDDAGRVAVITSSVGSMFGAKIGTAGGFFLGDALTDFSHDALAAKVATKGPNFPRAGARPVSSMAPTIVLGPDGAPLLALGASGGGRIPSAILQVLHRALATGASVDAAIDAPRFHPPAAGGLQIEPELGGTAAELRARGEAVDEPKPSFAAVTAVRRKREGARDTFQAAADRRKEGSAKIWRGAPAEDGESSPPR